MTLLYDFLNLVINAFSLGLFWGMVQEKERKSRALQQLDCVARIMQCTSALSSGFPLSQSNAEALDNRDGKEKHRLISYFLGNISAKNCNRIAYVKIIASHMWDVF